MPARRRPTIRFAGLGIPERGRGQFIAAAIAAFAAFALLGLFSSLVPGFIGGVLHQGSHAVQGAAVFGLFAMGRSPSSPCPGSAAARSSWPASAAWPWPAGWPRPSGAATSSPRSSWRATPA